MYGVKSLMGLVPRQWQSMTMVKSTIDWRTLVICSLIPKSSSLWKLCPSRVRGNLTLSSISKGPNFNVLSRRGQCGFERRCVAPRTSEL
jgi:hypothetical protein